MIDKEKLNEARKIAQGNRANRVSPPEIDPRSGREFPSRYVTRLLGLSAAGVLAVACSPQPRQPEPTPQPPKPTKETTPAPTPSLEPGTSRPNIEKGVERPVGGIGELVIINVNDLSELIKRLEKDWTIFFTQNEKGEPIIPSIVYEDGTPVLGVGPAGFSWNEDLQLWQIQNPGGKTEFVIPEIIAPGGWNEKNQKAGPTLFPYASFLFKENGSKDGNYRVGILYDPRTLAKAKELGIDLNGVTIIHAPGNRFDGFGLWTGTEKKITPAPGQQLIREENGDLRLINPDGSYYRRIVYWDNVKNPNQLHQTEAFAGPFEKQPTIPYLSDELANQLAVTDYTAIEQEGKEEYVAVAQVTDPQTGEQKSLIVAQPVLQKDNEGKETWVWQKTVPLALETNLVVPDPRVTNPELFDLKNPNTPIPQFVRAMEMAGINVNPQEVVANLEFRQIEGKGGEKYVVAYSKNTGDEISDNVPLFIRIEEGWREITFRHQSNIEIGIYFEPNNSFWSNQNSINIIARKFSGIVIPYFWHVNFPEQNRNDFSLSNTYENIARQSDAQIIPTAVVWQNRDFLPRWFVQNPNFDSFSQMLASTLNRIPSSASFIPVVNEPYPGDFLSSSLQLPPGYNNYIEYSFRTAREIKPGVPLILNNFDILLNQPNYQFTYNTASSLKNSGLIDGIGIQLHIDARNIPSEDSLIRSFSAWNELGLPVYLTEVSVDIPNERQRAEIFRTIVKAARATDVRSLNLWGAGPASWRGSQSTIFSDKFQPTPAYYAILKELFNN